ncbi:MAG TPA: hypothetical protein VFR58_12950 [Flavisolibacter sp.]|nr:hypothetical protein [Flavisolibacter sp.]
MQEEFSPQQSLALIQSMISKTRNNLSENRFYFLLWGWLSFLAILSQFVLKVVFQYRHHYFVWLVTIPAAIITVVHMSQRAKVSGVKTYVGESMSYLWTGIGISFFILSFIVSNSRGGWITAYPLFILFYGMGTFVSGRILRFRPLVIGGVINWVLALASIYVSFDYQLLFAAAAILTSYIIPGHLLANNKN